jgi:hypothetical protein
MRQGGAFLLYFIAQIMSSKSPVRSCDDIDETALSYAEIKALCAGNPLIAEKMNLDNDVARLRMLKSEHQSQHYRLEDSLLKHFPQQTAAVTERIAGIEKDIAAYTAEKEKYTEVTVTDGAASVAAKFPGMTVGGVMHTEKETAAKALLDACKGIKGREAELPIGEFMGFKLSLSYASFGQTVNLLMRGAMTYQTELGTDAFGNIQRITNALDKLPERLEATQNQLANLENQVAAAKEELAKPFAAEDELKSKEARLALLNADLNIDGEGSPQDEVSWGEDGEFDVEGDDAGRASDADFVARVGEALDEMGVAYERGFDPDETGGRNESSAGACDRPRPDCNHAGERVPAKAKPSVLDEIRCFSGGGQSPGCGGASGRTFKQSERDI